LLGVTMGRFITFQLTSHLKSGKVNTLRKLASGLRLFGIADVKEQDKFVVRNPR